MVQFFHSTFDALTKQQLYDMLRLRSEVFVVEQECIWLDVDGHDDHAIHVWGEEDGKIVAVARFFKAGDYYEEATLGRVAVNPAHRKTGTGRALMEYTLNTMRELHGAAPIKIMAQAYLQKFYGSYGFNAIGDAFDDCGIMHYYMIRK